ncbi:MAG: hypothetical protein AB7F79_04575 [Steroidobacteraceae bacterium]
MTDSAIRLLPTGTVEFEATGRAVYQGSYQHLLDSPLMNQDLTLADDILSAALTPLGKDQLSASPANRGYNPYSHQSPAHTVRVKKPSLRELSQWIEMKKRLEAESK